MIKLKKYLDLGLEIFNIETEEIIFDHDIRKYCIDNKCGKFNKNFMCPPSVGTVDEYKKIVNSYKEGYLLLIKDKIQNADINKYYKSQRILHEQVLNLEKKLLEIGKDEVLGFIAGECKVCIPCKKVEGSNKCIYPNMARTSLEAIGVNVVDTVSKKGIEIVFGTDDITWIGMVLFK